MNWFWDILRKILIGIDFVVYGLVEQVLQTIVDLSNVQIFTDVAINEFSRRIYIILGLVMVFKVMMSFIQILINPDSMSDKEKGAGNILKRVVIALALIVFVPSIFKMARDVQGYVLPIIPKVILGIESSDTATDPISQSNIGSAMAWYSFLPFFDYANETCDTGTIQKIVSNDTTDYEINSVGAALNHITDKDACNNGGYKYTHKYLVSTLVGAYLLFSLVQIAIQIAIRALKLGICEFVAPIPIASYIDPKTSKSTFDKWVSTSIKVYLDLFIQLIAVYFVVFVFITIFDNASISSIVSSAGNNWWRASLIVLFIIVGLLKFVKEFPKFLSGLLGIKTDGAIGSILKPSKEWLTGGALGSTFAGLAGMAHAGLSARNYSKFKNEGGFRQFGRTASAVLRTGAGSAKAISDGKGIKDTYGVSNYAHAATVRRVNKSFYKGEDKKKYKSGTEEYNNAQALIRTLQSQISDENSNKEKFTKMAAEAEARGAVDEYIEAQTNAEKAEQKIAELNSKIETLQKVKQPLRPSSYGIGKLSAAANNFAGIPNPDSKSYRKAAGYMNDAKKIFNEAKSKVVEDPTVVNDRIKIKDKNGNTYGEGTFADVYSAYVKAKTTGIATLDGKNYDAATMEAVYGETLKTTASTYVTRVHEGTIPNGTMKLDIDMLNNSFENDMIISAADQSKFKSDYDKNKPGNYFKKADEVAREYEIRARELESSENNSK